MSGEKRAVAHLSWEFTAGLVRGILIGGGIVQDRSCMGGRRASCWDKAGGGDEGWNCTGGNSFFFFGGGVENESEENRKTLLTTLLHIYSLRVATQSLTGF